MKGVGHASASLLIQLQTAHRAVAATLCDLLNRHLPVWDQTLRRGNCDLESQFMNTW
jgi:hypothetical protein